MTRILHISAVAFFSLLLAACGSTSVKPEKPSTPAPSTGKSGGGYYLDDGPGDISQAEIDRIPDAVPRVEPIRAANSRPYTALGRRYVPMTGYQPYRQRGIASWYGKRYHGNLTVSGERYDMYGMTAAHTTLPIPSYVRVTNPENGRSVVLRVNDRGPFLHDRIIDVSYVAAHKLGIVAKGSGLVDVELIDPTNYSVSASTPSSPTTSSPSDATTAVSRGVYVQVGAFKSRENAERLRDDIQDRNLASTADGRNVPIHNWYNNDTYRVWLGPFQNRFEADQAANRINQSIGGNAIVVFQN